MTVTRTIPTKPEKGHFNEEDAGPIRLDSQSQRA